MFWPNFSVKYMYIDNAFHCFLLYQQYKCCKNLIFGQGYTISSELGLVSFAFFISKPAYYLFFVRTKCLITFHCYFNPLQWLFVCYIICYMYRYIYIFLWTLSAQVQEQNRQANHISWVRSISNSNRQATCAALVGCRWANAF